MKGIKIFEVWDPICQEYGGTITEDMDKLNKGAKIVNKRQVEAGFLREVKK